MNLTRRHLALAAAMGLAGHPFSRLAWAQGTYPSRTIRILVPFPPGGSLDPVARLVGEKLTAAWGQQVIVENRAGANGMIATQAAAAAPADGHTLLLTASTHVINPLLMKNLPFDTERDFVPLVTAIKSEFMLVVHPTVPASTLQEFIAYAKARPGAVNYGSAGVGNGNHIAAELFNQLAGTKLNHVPYKGGGPAMTDLVGGQLQAMFSVPSTAIPHVRSGRLKALAFTGTTSPRGLTGVPSFAQAGLAGYDLRSWQGFLVPAATPKPVVDKLVAELSRIVNDPEFHEKLAATGQEVWFNGPRAFAELMKADSQKFAEIIRTADIKLE